MRTAVFKQFCPKILLGEGGGRKGVCSYLYINMYMVAPLNREQLIKFVGRNTKHEVPKKLPENSENPFVFPQS